MLQVRQGVFETNSSSTHSITIVPQSEFNEWKNGDTYFNDGWWYNSTNPIKDNTFITKDEAISLVMTSDYLPESNPYEMSEEELDELFADEYSIYSYEKFSYDSYLESYVKHCTTEHGDNIVAFGQYGHD